MRAAFIAAFFLIVIPGSVGAQTPASVPKSMGIKASRTRPSATTAPVSATQPSAGKWSVGQTVEVKSGGTWGQRIIRRIEGEWFLVERRGFYEWVEPWRLRAPGSQEDDLPTVDWNHSMLATDIQPPPRAKPGDPPQRVRSDSSARRIGQSSKLEASATYGKDPAFRKADWSKACRLDLAGEIVGLTPDSAPEVVMKTTDRPIALMMEKPAARFFKPKPETLRIARSTPVLYVGYSAGSDEELCLEKVDLAQGRSTGVYTMGHQVALVDVSPSGMQVLLRSDAFGIGNHDRLEVWNMDGSSPKRTLLFVPYDEDSDEHRDVKTAHFVDETHLFTVSTDGQVALWDVSTARAVYTTRVIRGTWTLSKGGRYLVIEGGHAVFILEALSGKVMCELPLVGASGLSYNFSPSGKRLVGVTQGKVLVWDVSTGEQIRRFFVPPDFRYLRMLGDTYALLNGFVLFDLDKGVGLWQYHIQGIEGIGPSGRVWSARAYNHGKSEHAEVKGYDLPQAEDLKAVRDLPAENLLKPGAKVSIAVPLSVDRAQRQQVVEAMRRQALNRQLVVVDKAPLRIVVSSEFGRRVNWTYGDPEASGAMASKEESQSSEQIAKVAIEFEGKTVWETHALPRPRTLLTIKGGQSVAQALIDATAPDIEFLKKVQLPAVVSKPPDKYVCGKTSLGKEGK